MLDKLKEYSRGKIDYYRDLDKVEIDWEQINDDCEDIKKIINSRNTQIFINNSWISYPDKVLGCIDYNQVPLFNINELVVDENQIPGNFLSKTVVSCSEKDFNIRLNAEYFVWVEYEHYCPVIIIGRKEADTCRIVDITYWNIGNTLLLSFDEMFKFILSLKNYINVVEVGTSELFPLKNYYSLLKEKGIRTVALDLSESHYDVLKYAFYSKRIKIFDEQPYLNYEKNEYAIVNQILQLKVIDSKVSHKNLIVPEIAALCGVVNLVLGNMFNKSN